MRTEQYNHEHECAKCNRIMRGPYRYCTPCEDKWNQSAARDLYYHYRVQNNIEMMNKVCKAFESGEL